MKMHRIQNSKKGNKFKDLKMSDFKTQYNATVITILWYWHNDRPINKQNLIQNSKVNPSIYGHLILTVI